MRCGRLRRVSVSQPYSATGRVSDRLVAGARRSAERKIVLTRRGVTIGRGRFALQAYKWRRTRFRLTRQGLSTLRQTRPLRVRLSFSGVDDHGDSISARDRLTLRFRQR